MDEDNKTGDGKSIGTLLVVSSVDKALVDGTTWGTSLKSSSSSSSSSKAEENSKVDPLGEAVTIESRYDVVHVVVGFKQ